MRYLLAVLCVSLCGCFDPVPVPAPTVEVPTPGEVAARELADRAVNESIAATDAEQAALEAAAASDKAAKEAKDLAMSHADAARIAKSEAAVADAKAKAEAAQWEASRIRARANELAKLRLEAEMRGKSERKELDDRAHKAQVEADRRAADQARQETINAMVKIGLWAGGAMMALSMLGLIASTMLSLPVGKSALITLGVGGGGIIALAQAIGAYAPHLPLIGGGIVVAGVVAIAIAEAHGHHGKASDASETADQLKAALHHAVSYGDDVAAIAKEAMPDAVETIQAKARSLANIHGLRDTIKDAISTVRGAA